MLETMLCCEYSPLSVLPERAANKEHMARGSQLSTMYLSIVIEPVTDDKCKSILKAAPTGIQYFITF